MATVEMQERDGRFVGFQYYETIADGATGDNVFVPPLPDGKNLTATVVPGAGSGNIQTTTSSKADIIAGTATWIDWAEGSVAVDTADVIVGSITGIRGVSVSGEIKIEIIL